MTTPARRPTSLRPYNPALLGLALLAATTTPRARAEARGAASEGDETRESIVLTLDEATEKALLQNLDIRSSLRDWKSAQTGIGRARGAFDPVASFFYQHAQRVQPQASSLDAEISVSASDFWTTGVSQKLFYGASYSVTVDGTRSKSNNPFVTLSPTYSADVTLTYTQPILKGFGRDANRRLIEQALNNAENASDAFLVQARDVLKSTIDAYWDLVFAVEDLKVREAALELAESLLRKNRIMVEVGTLPPLDVVQSEASVAERQREIISAKAAVANAEDVLRRLMGVPEDSPWWGSALVPAERPEFRSAYVDLGEALDEALQRRAELRQADRRLANGELDLAAAKDSRLPQLDFELELSTAGLGGDARDFVDTDGDTVPDTFLKVSNGGFGDAFEQVGDREFDSWRTSLRYSQPLPDRAARADVTSRRLSLEKARIDVERTRQSVILEVRRAVRDVVTAREQISAAQASRVLQEKKLDAEIKKFENGLSTNFEVLQFQTDLTQAESSELRALIDYNKALVALRKARGTLLDAVDTEAIR